MPNSSLAILSNWCWSWSSHPCRWFFGTNPAHQQRPTWTRFPSLTLLDLREPECKVDDAERDAENNRVEPISHPAGEADVGECSRGGDGAVVAYGGPLRVSSAEIHDFV